MAKIEIASLTQKLIRYSSTLAIIVGAFLLRQALVAHLGAELPPYITFYPAVIFAAIIAGLWPGVLATLLAALLAGYWILPPQGQFKIELFSDAVGLAIFLLMGVFVSLLAEGYRRNRQKAAAYDKEAALRESRERLRVTLTSIGDAVIAADISGRVTFLNPVAAALTGWQPEEAHEQPVQNVFQIINEQTREPAENIVARVLKEKYVVALANHTALLTREGREIPIEDSAAPILDNTGNLIGVVLVFHDVTEKRRAQETLRRQADLLRLSFDAIIVWRLNGAIESWNRGAEQLYGYNESEALGRVTHELLRTVHLEPWPEIEAKLRESGAWEGELRHATKEGREVFVSARHQLIVGADGVERILETNRDITERKQAEIESRAGEQRLRLAADAAQLGIFEWTVPTDTAVWENQRMYEIFGIPVTTDPVNRDRFVRETLHPEDLPRFSQELEESMQPGALFRGAYRIRRVHDGQWRWIQYFSKFELTPDGKPLRLVGVLEDITERKRAEEALRESERQFRELAEGIPQLAWMANADGWISWYNQRWYQYTGTTPQQMEGWGWQSVHDPNELPKVMERWKISITTGEPFDMVFPLRRADGILCPFLTRVMPLRDSQGKVVRWFGTNTDISEQRRTEEALRESEERWSTTLHSIGDAVISTCAQGKVIFMNAVAEKLTGWPLSEAHGKDLIDIFHIVNEVTRIKPESPVAKVIRLGQVVGLANHTALISRNGTEFPIEDSGAPIRDQEGRITGVVLVFHDVGDKRKAEKALRDSERLATTGRLASTLAHEIHNPLEAVVNLLFLIDHDPHASETVRQYTTMAGEELARVTQMTRHMLAFQREAAKPVPIKIGEILGNVVALYEKKIESAGIQVQKEVEFEEEFLGLPGEMRQVFANLVGNAIEAIGKNGKLRLHAYPSRDWRRGQRGLRVTVADNGPGIPPAVRDKIFDPFFTTKGESGTGLGLWITSGIIEKNDGRLQLRTVTRDGRSGTCFSVFFPFLS
jgi:PAS domain S-box-containing protein